MLSQKNLDTILRKAMLCREFELTVAEQLNNKDLNIPTYLSIGQELTPATISEAVSHKVNLFGQHRGHSWYLSFGGTPESLMEKLRGREGSASISLENDRVSMFGHDGLMGSQGPIGTGFALASGKPTIIIFGDASVEEDYALGALGYAVTKNLPILYIVEDNGLSILTEKSVRRSWSIVDVAKGFGMRAFNVSDDVSELYEKVSSFSFDGPMLLNVKTTRLYWHAGGGQDPGEKLDKLASYCDISSINTLGDKTP